MKKTLLALSLLALGHRLIHDVGNIILIPCLILELARAEVLRADGRRDGAYNALEHDRIKIRAQRRMSRRSVRGLKAEKEARDEDRRHTACDK